MDFKDYLKQNELLKGLPEQFIELIAQRDTVQMAGCLTLWHSHIRKMSSSDAAVPYSPREMFDYYISQRQQKNTDIKSIMQLWWMHEDEKGLPNGYKLKGVFSDRLKRYGRGSPSYIMRKLDSKQFAAVFNDVNVCEPTPEFHTFFNSNTNILIKHIDFPRTKNFPYSISRHRIKCKFDEHFFDVKAYLEKEYTNYYKNNTFNGQKWDEYIIDLVADKLTELLISYDNELSEIRINEIKNYKIKFSNEFEKMAELCKMGDIVAMYDMAQYFYNKCNDEQQKTLKDYEINPCKETKQAIADLVSGESSSHVMMNMRYYMMWLERAAVYGNINAKAIVDRCDYYKEMSALPCEKLKEKHFCLELPIGYLYAGGFRDAGICSDEDDTTLEYKQFPGYFRIEDVYEDAYEREVYYKYLDEFFMELEHCPHRCMVDNEAEEIAIKLDRNKRIREEYWKKQKDCDKRKYKFCFSKS